MERIRVSVFLKQRYSEPERLFDYDFIANPLVGDEIHEDGNIYTITDRFWMLGSLFLLVTDEPTTGVILA